jgi:hypothetical protein
MRRSTVLSLPLQIVFPAFELLQMTYQRSLVTFVSDSDKGIMFVIIFVQLGLNEADMNKSSLILLYKYTSHRIYTEIDGLMPG